MRAPLAALLAAGMVFAVTPPAAGQEAEGESSEVVPDEPLGTGQVVIREGHIDIGPRFVDGNWTLMIRDDTVEPSEWRQLPDVVLQAIDAATVEVPDNPDFAFLGEPGDQIWLLPQVQDLEILWPGWNTQEPEVATTVNREVTWSVHDVDGPGDFLLFVNEAFGAPAVIFDSREPYPQQSSIEVHTHAHGNWTFTSQGVYLLGIEMSATTVDGDQVSATGTVRFAVGDETDPGDALAAAEIAEPAGTADSGGDGAAAPADDSGGDGLADGDEGVDSAAAGADDGGSSGSPPWIPLAAAALVLALAGTTLLLWARRRRQGRQSGSRGSDAVDPDKLGEAIDPAGSS